MATAGRKKEVPACTKSEAGNLQAISQTSAPVSKAGWAYYAYEAECRIEAMKQAVV